MNITHTVIGDMWMGLWEKDEPFVFNENDEVLLPRRFKPWLEALKVERFGFNSVSDKWFVPEGATFYIR